MTTILTFYKDVAGYYHQWSQDRLQQHQLEIVYQDRRTLTTMEQVTGLISGTLSEEELKMLPSLKWVIVPYTGLDGLDLNMLKERGIHVDNTSAHGHFVAERALALTLAVMGRIVTFHNGLVVGDWGDRVGSNPIQWQSLYHKKVAIIGYGVIGQAFRQLLRPFQGQVGIMRYKDRHYEDVSILGDLKGLLKWCDVLILSAPLTTETECMINQEALEVLEGKIVVNIARGKIIHEEALYKALEEGRLAGYGSDVWYNYPSKTSPSCHPSKLPFHELENVVMTPHNAGFEVTSRQVRYEDVLNKIIVMMDQG